MKHAIVLIAVNIKCVAIAILGMNEFAVLIAGLASLRQRQGRTHPGVGSLTLPVTAA